MLSRAYLRGGGIVLWPPFGFPVKYDYLGIVLKIEPCPLSLEFGQKIWAEKRTQSE